jgi:hypothetical protein
METRVYSKRSNYLLSSLKTIFIKCIFMDSDLYIYIMARLFKVTAVPTFVATWQGGSVEYVKIARSLNIDLDLQHQYQKYRIERNLTFSSL